MREEFRRLVREEYWEDFVKFLETGDCRKEFADYMNENEDCQRAIDIALAEICKPLRNLAKSKIRKPGKGN